MITINESITIELETHRGYWADIARSNGWYTEPFYVHVWIDDKGDIADSVSYRGLDKDIIDTY